MSFHGEFLDTVVVGVHHVEMAATIEGEAVWGVELAGLGPCRAETFQIHALVREPLNATADGTDPDSIMPIDANGDWPLEDGLAIFEAAEGAPEAARLDVIVSPGQQELTVRRELLDPAHRSLGGVEVPA